ncbi:MAG: winged helix-turn-helix domain-containing protein [Promethearchaeota archaeon]
MEIKQDDIQSIAVIGFDEITGPVLKWKKEFTNTNIQVEQFLTSFYIMFNNGSNFLPKAIQYDNFSVITIFREMDLTCFFLKNKDLLDAANLEQIEQEYIPKLEKQVKEKTIKEEMIGLLENDEMTVKEIRKHFKFNANTVRKYLRALEEEGKLKRIGKDGRAIIWGAS